MDFGSGIWTYRELDEAAEAVAAWLAPTVAPGDIVAVCLENSPALVAVALAAARLGAVYLPLGPRPPAGRVAALVGELPVGCLITGGGEAAPGTAYGPGRDLRLPLAPHTALTLHPPQDRPELPSATRSMCEASFYAVLTSGSTGTPKAVGVPATSLGNFLRAYGVAYGAGAGCRHALLIRPGFDAHLGDMWPALAFGATLCVPSAPEEVARSVGALVDWFREQAVTHTIVPTPLAELLFELPWPDGLALRHLFAGGDKLRSRPRHPTATVHNAYGPAEATVLCLTHRLDERPGPAAAEGSADGRDEGAPPIGRPVSGVRIGVIGEDGQLLARDSIGELVIAGAQVSLGYLARPAETARRFTAPPPGFGDGYTRVYRTGDQVRMRRDGVLEYVGRLDQQVKISGVRIETAEVEAALERAGAGAVRQAVVVPVGGGHTETRLAAFLRGARDGERIDVTEVLRGSREWLPEQALPAHVTVVETYPCTANGKVDRRALAATFRSPGPPPRPDGTDRTPVATAPTDVTALVLRTCEHLLGTGDLKPGDNFLAAGGTSLTAMRLIHAVESHCGVRVRVSRLLRQPDLSALCRHVEELMRDGRAPQATDDVTERTGPLSGPRTSGAMT
ncbi:hypothetical protein A6A06_12395 [Streptomyces sp. CB02923]|nr:hypothetical protein A6A06_12395 [Streptomyces sp. CB02923]